MYISGIIQQLLERLEYLFPDQMRAWRKEQNIRLEYFWYFFNPSNSSRHLSSGMTDLTCQELLNLMESRSTWQPHPGPLRVSVVI